MSIFDFLDGIFFGRTEKSGNENRRICRIEYGKEDEYDDDTENIKWVNDYPLIKIYNEEFNKWDDEKTEKYENEKNLRICSLCRK